MTKGHNLIGYFMKKFSEQSIDPHFNLFGEVFLAISNLSDEEFDKIVEDKK